jgi:uncharacterized protein
VFGLVRTLLLFLLLLVLARALMRFFGGVVQGATGQTGPAGREPHSAPAAKKMIQDPVCGTYVLPGKALELARGRDTLFFCSDACRQKYLARS